MFFLYVSKIMLFIQSLVMEEMGNFFFLFVYCLEDNINDLKMNI